MTITDQAIKEILLEQQRFSSREIAKIEKKAAKAKKNLAHFLLEDKRIGRDELGQVIANHFKIGYVNLAGHEIKPKMDELITSLVSKRCRAIAFDQDKKGVIHLAVSDPGDDGLRKTCEGLVDHPIQFYYAEEASFKELIKKYEQTDEVLQESIEALLEQAEDITRAEDLPIIKIVDQLLKYAHQSKASDVHIEPYEQEVLVRFRLDGLLHDIVSIPKRFHELIVARIKILSRLRTDEHQAAQDGRLRFKSEGIKVDVRVSIVPVIYGEKVVMRILSEKARQYDLENLGFSPRDFEKIESAIQEPWGMILVTGPTGCGKTTTLYSVLKKLNVREVNISTIEDPVEYDLEGISQIQVNPKTNLTFAAGLRAIVRQDPDIIMVGEIRDEETARIAVNSAMTGHLVLSTLHTNDAATAMPRLLDMSIQPFLVASTVNVIIAQRLVRRLCAHCRKAVPIDAKMLELIRKQLSPELVEEYGLNKRSAKVYASGTCKECHNGFKGRVGIFEVLSMTEQIKQMIMDKANATKIKEKAVSDGMTTMIEDGIRKVLDGTTTIEEILRVAKE